MCEKDLTIDEVSKAVDNTFTLKKVIIDDRTFSYYENFRNSEIEILVSEYHDIYDKVHEINPNFNLLKEGLIIKHFTRIGLERMSFSMHRDIKRFMKNIIQLNDMQSKSEDISYLDKFMSVFSKDDIAKVEKKLESRSEVGKMNYTTTDHFYEQIGINFTWVRNELKATTEDIAKYCSLTVDEIEGFEQGHSLLTDMRTLQDTYMKALMDYAREHGIHFMPLLSKICETK